MAREYRGLDMLKIEFAYKTGSNIVHDPQPSYAKSGDRDAYGVRATEATSSVANLNSFHPCFFSSAKTGFWVEYCTYLLNSSL